MASGATFRLQDGYCLLLLPGFTVKEKAEHRDMSMCSLVRAERRPLRTGWMQTTCLQLGNRSSALKGFILPHFHECIYTAPDHISTILPNYCPLPSNRLSPVSALSIFMSFVCGLIGPLAWVWVRVVYLSVGYASVVTP